MSHGHIPDLVLRLDPKTLVQHAAACTGCDDEDSRRGNLVCIDSHAKDALWRAAVRREVSGSEFTESVRAITDPANGNAWWRLRAKEFFLDRVAAYCCGDHPEGESSVPTILVVPKRIVSPLQTTEGVA